MNFSTPYLIYILEAYGLSIGGLLVFMYLTIVQWKKSKELTQASIQSPTNCYKILKKIRPKLNASKKN